MGESQEVQNQPGLELLSGALAEVRWLRREQPGLKAFWDAQEACLVDLIRRALEGGAATVEALRHLVGHALEELVAGSPLGEEIRFLARKKRWREESPGYTSLVQLTLWEWPVVAGVQGGSPAPRAAVVEGPAGDGVAESEKVAKDGSPGDIAPEDEGWEGAAANPVPAVLASAGERPDGGLSDELGLRWLGELAEGRRKYAIEGTVPGPLLTAVRARLNILWNLWQRCK